VKGRRPGPLDEGREKGAGAAGHIKSFGQAGKQEPFRAVRSRHDRLPSGRRWRSDATSAGERCVEHS